MKKRLLAILLTLAMTVGLLPVATFAAGAYTVHYQDNYGGDSMPSDLWVGDSSSCPGGTFQLYGPPTDPAPTHGPDGSGNPVIFMGWSMDDPGTIYTVSDTRASVKDLITTITLGSNESGIVYAVWGLDEDCDNVPDVYESQLYYEPNTSPTDTVGNMPSATAFYERGETAYLVTNPVPTSTSGNLFLGWTFTPYSVFTKNDRAPDTLTSVDFTDSDVYVYAAWGEDTNNNSVADVLESYSVIYRPNGGELASIPVDSNKYLQGDMAVLKSAIPPTHSNENGKRVVFAGWSLTENTAICSAGDTPPPMVENAVTFNQAANIDLYPVWGYDTNRNDIADVNEEQYTLTYVYNNGDADYTDTSKYLADNTVPLAGGKHHDPVGGNNVVFIGWTTDQEASKTIYTVNNQSNLPDILTNVKFTDSSIVVYGVWGYDTNKDGIADADEAGYTLTYDKNGGDSITNSGTLYATGTKVGLNLLPTHGPDNNVDVAFVGWSLTGVPGILMAGDTVPATIEEVTFGTDDITVYAVWSYDKNGNGKADVTEATYKLTYDVNTGVDWNVPVDNNAYIEDDEVELAIRNNTSIAHNPVGGTNVVFLGWSTLQMPVLTGDDRSTFDDARLITKVKFADRDITVYAVWGLDTDGDGTPDVKEDYYKLTFDPNEGNRGAFAEKFVMDGDTVALTTATNPTHDDVNGVRVLFLGWSDTKEDILGKGDKAPSTYVKDKITINGASKIVYALWGYDENNNNKADVTEAKYTLTYLPGDVTNPQPDMPAASSDNLTGQTVKLKMDEPASGTYKGETVYFLGWSATKQPVMSKGDSYQDKLITEVTFEKNHIDVYAVWGYDTNGDTVADVKEDTYTLTYMPNDGKGVPKDNNLYLYTDTATLETVNLPIHDADHGKKVVFAGWTGTKQISIFEAGDTAPTYLTQVTFTDKTNKVVYAAWGYDINGNNIADVNETQYTLHYDPNGGSNAPADEKYLPDEEVTLNSQVPTHQDDGDTHVLFVGWSETQVANILSAGDQQPDLVTGITMPDADKDVYAVWSYDQNNNGVADIKETGKLLTYDANGGDDSSMPAQDTNKYAPGTEVTLSKTVPTHGQDDGKDVVFIGWTTAKNSQIFKVTDTAPNTVEKVTFQNDSITVYAAWGYDSNGNNKADVTEMKYDLNYIHNGALSGMPDNLPDQFVKGNKATLSTDKPLHQDVNGVPVVFIGWSLELERNILSAGDNYNCITEVDFTDHDISVYAVWGYDTDGDGTADATQEAHKLLFDNNGGYNGPESGKYYLTDTVIDLTAVKQPIHADEKEVPVAFIGWSETAPSGIYTKDD
ncbi:MAG: InlB B-repeat-containing protein, partial [Ruminiclostridium sp.]|nr:InlB B-repeat-containing protein [Ruminiclostridium sp.]